MGPGQEGNRAPNEGARPGSGESGGSAWKRRVGRRTFIKGGAVAGGLLGAGGLGYALSNGSSTRHVSQAGDKRRIPPPPQADPKPNILVVIVDQMRTPQWFPTGTALAAALPNITRIRNQA